MAGKNGLLFKLNWLKTTPLLWALFKYRIFMVYSVSRKEQLAWKIPWRSLVGCSPWGCEESDTTERLHFHFSLSCIGEGKGNPLQCSCLEIAGKGEPGGLPSMGSHRVRHDWSDLAAAERSNTNIILFFQSYTKIPWNVWDFFMEWDTRCSKLSFSLEEIPKCTPWHLDSRQHQRVIRSLNSHGIYLLSSVTYVSYQGVLCILHFLTKLWYPTPPHG